jgi:hypothetical protein
VVEMLAVIGFIVVVAVAVLLAISMFLHTLSWFWIMSPFWITWIGLTVAFLVLAPIATVMLSKTGTKGRGVK